MTSYKKLVENANDLAKKQVYSDFNTAKQIQAFIASQLPDGCKVLTMSDAEDGFNTVVWTPKGRRINSDHSSGYWVFKTRCLKVSKGE